MCVCVYLIRVCALLPLISSCQVVTLFHQNIESTSFVAVADVQQDLTAHSGVAIVTILAVHAHHAVDTTLFHIERRQRENVKVKRNKEGWIGEEKGEQHVLNIIKKEHTRERTHKVLQNADERRRRGDEGSFVERFSTVHNSKSKFLSSTFPD